jgi:hypothetical protein
MFQNKRLYQRQQRRRFGAACLWLVLVLGVSGGMSLVSGVEAQRQITPTRSIGELTTPKPASEQSAPSTPFPSYLPYAVPTAINLPTVGIGSELISVGKTADGDMEVPAYPNFDKAAWYRYSPTPGQYGAAVIIGHVDSYANDNGASVFFNLSKLKLGDPINVQRADGTTASFAVRAVRDYGKNGLPRDVIYVPVTDSAELRLVTCGGNFVKAAGTYDSNTVIFATLR